MMITPDCTIAAIATDAPATIRIFQEHEIDFCCGGKVALKEVCATRGLDLDALLVDLRAAASPAPAEPTWDGASLTALVQHIQARYHEPLRKELPRLDAMLNKVVSRHGTHLPEVLVPLQQTFKQLQQDLLAHMAKEDRVLFPFIVALGGWRSAAGFGPGVDRIAHFRDGSRSPGCRRGARAHSRNDVWLRAAGLGLPDIPRTLRWAGAVRNRHASACASREQHPFSQGRAAGQDSEAM